jgi:hypothetical protein
MTQKQIFALAITAKQVTLELTFTQRAKTEVTHFIHYFQKVGTDNFRIFRSTLNFNEFIKYQNPDLQSGQYWEHTHTNVRTVLC